MSNLQTITPERAAALMREGAVLVDVREADEHARERIPGARHHALSRLDAEHPARPGDDVLIFHCRSGARTQANAPRLAAADECETYILEGGIDAWKKAGLPVALDRASRSKSCGRCRSRPARSCSLASCSAGWSRPAFYRSVGLCRRRAHDGRRHRLLRHGEAARPDAMEQARACSGTDRHAPLSAGFPDACNARSLSVGSGSLVGLILGLIGGGGSILAVPLLVYVVGVPSPHVAIGTSAIAVAASAAINLIGHARAGTVRWPCAIVFALSGIVGAAIGAQLGKMVDGNRLLALFGALMIVVGLLMLRPRRSARQRRRAARSNDCQAASAAIDRQWRARRSAVGVFRDRRRISDRAGTDRRDRNAAPRCDRLLAGLGHRLRLDDRGELRVVRTGGLAHRRFVRPGRRRRRRAGHCVGAPPCAAETRADARLLRRGDGRRTLRRDEIAYRLACLARGAQASPYSSPSISRMFCTAAPEAPLPRLSSRATRTA